jgi:hypothetical protein
MFVACGRTRPAQGPPVIGGPPSVEARPEQGGPLRRQQSKKIHQIHERLFQDAQHHFEARDFQQAIQGFTRLLALHPKGSLENEARWLLGQSYGQVQDWDAAQSEYRVLATAPVGQRYQAKSAQRLTEIQGLLEEFEVPPQQTKAIRLALNQLPETQGFDQGIQKMKEDGVTSLLIDLGCKRTALNLSSLNEPHRAQDFAELLSVLQSFTERSHRAGLGLYVGVNLRCLGHWAPSEHPEWHDRVYHVATGRFQTTRWFDLFHSGYQQFLMNFLSQLCQGGLDGLVFLNDHPLGTFDGVTQAGLKRFQKGFGATFVPSQVFYEGFNPLQGLKSSTGLSHVKRTDAKDALFWRWAGWKARERLNMLEALVDHLRLQYRSVQFGLEIHPHALTDPVRALVNYAEDAMDAVGRSFSFFFVRPEIDRRSTFTEKSVIDKLRRISTKAILDKLLPVVGDPRKVWVSMPAKGGQRVRPQTMSIEFPPLEGFPSGIGVVHDLRAFS